jgi:hypothetical protein
LQEWFGEFAKLNGFLYAVEQRAPDSRRRVFLRWVQSDVQTTRPSLNTGRDDRTDSLLCFGAALGLATGEDNERNNGSRQSGEVRDG